MGLSPSLVTGTRGIKNEPNMQKTLLSWSWHPNGRGEVGNKSVTRTEAKHITQGQGCSLGPCSSGSAQVPCLSPTQSHQNTHTHTTRLISKTVNYSGEHSTGILSPKKRYQGIHDMVQLLCAHTFSFHFNLLPDFYLLFCADKLVWADNKNFKLLLFKKI